MDVYAALELGERFLPRPTTTFTKRRLYCWVETRGGRVVSVAIPVRIRATNAETLQISSGVGGLSPTRGRGRGTHLKTLDGATLGKLLLVLLGDLGSLTAHLLRRGGNVRKAGARVSHRRGRRGARVGDFSRSFAARFRRRRARGTPARERRDAYLAGTGERAVHLPHYSKWSVCVVCLCAAPERDPEWPREGL